MPLYESAKGIEITERDSAALIATSPSNAAIQGENLALPGVNEKVRFII
jgi:hypothetical protein